MPINPNIIPARQLVDRIQKGEFTPQELIDWGINDQQLRRVNAMLVQAGFDTAEQIAWKEVLESHSSTKMEQFMNQYPNSHIEEAGQLKSQWKKEELDRDYSIAKLANTIEALENFRSKYPDAYQAEIANQISEIKRNQILGEYMHVMNDSAATEEEMKIFIQKYVGTKEASDVQEKMNILAKNRITSEFNACTTVADYREFCIKYPQSEFVVQAETRIKELQEQLIQSDNKAWKQAEETRKLDLINQYLTNPQHTLHRKEAENLKVIVEQELRDEPRIMNEINQTLMNPYKDVIDYLQLCAKYPQKKDYIKKWMLNDMRQTPGRYQRDEMYVLMNDIYQGDVRFAPTSSVWDLAKPLNGKALFTPMEIMSANVLTYERIQWIMEKPEKHLDDTQDVIPKEDCFEMEPNSTDVFFFGVPGSGKTSVLSGLFSVSSIGDGMSFKLLAKEMHKGYGYAVCLKQKISNCVFPARTKVFSLTESLPTDESGFGIGLNNNEGFDNSFGVPTMGDNDFGNSLNSGLGNSVTEPVEIEKDLFIQIVDSEIRSANGSINRLNIVEMPGEGTLRFAAARSNDLAMLGEGARKLFTNSNNKIMFFVIDPNDKKLNEVMLNGVPIKISQAEALECVAQFILSMVKDGKINNLKSVHVILAKSDLLDLNEGGIVVGREAKIRNMMNNTDYASLVATLKELCSKEVGNINSHCDHTPHLFTFSLGRILPGDMLIYDPDDSKKILRVMSANTISVGKKTAWDTVTEFMNANLINNR